jgi:hypothetical protein
MKLIALVLAFKSSLLLKLGCKDDDVTNAAEFDNEVDVELDDEG